MQFQFDASQFDPTMGLQPWADGWHDVVITASSPQPTKAGNGQGMLVFTIISRAEGPNKPQMIRLNLWNANPQAVEIANKELSAITYVTLGANQGRINFNDTSELHNIPFRVLVGRQQNRPNMMDFLAYQDARGNDPKGMGSGAGPQPPQQAPFGGNGQPAFQPAPAAPQGFQQPAPAAPPAAAAPAWMNGAQQAPQAAPAAPAPAWNPNPPQQAPQAQQAAFPPAGPQAQPPMAQPPQQWGQPPAQAQQAPAPWQR